MAWAAVTRDAQEAAPVKRRAVVEPAQVLAGRAAAPLADAAEWKAALQVRLPVQERARARMVEDPGVQAREAQARDEAAR